MHSTAMLPAITPMLADLIVESPIERNSTLIVGLLAAGIGIVLVYLIYRAKRSKKP